MFSLAMRPQNALEIFWQGVQLWARQLRYVAPIAVVFAALALMPHFFVPELESGTAMRDLFTVHAMFFISYFIIGLTIFSVILLRIYLDVNDMPGGFFVALIRVLKRLPFIITVEIVARLLVMVGFFLLFFPGIYIYVVLFMGLPLVILQNEGVVSALKRSFAITRYNWWHAAVVILLPIIIYWSLDYLIYLIPLAHPFVQNVASDNGWVLKAILHFVLTTLFLPYVGALVVILLRDLELRYAEMIEPDISS